MPSRQDLPSAAKVFRLHIFKDSFKFSAAHMTVFPDGSKEPLHGHNYQVSLSVELASIGFADTISFSVFKDALKPLCAAWDDKVLLPLGNAFVTTKVAGGEVETVVCGKRYVFPEDETVLLAIENVTVEQLADAMLSDLLAALGPAHLEKVHGIELRIDETVGQGASVTYRHV